MSNKRKYYVVWEGHHPGVYDNWAVAKAQIENFPNARYKGYPNLKSAQEAYKKGWKAAFRQSQKTSAKVPFIKNSISVDAASSGNPGRVEYRGVWTHDKSLIFHAGPFEEGTNNLGEFLALIHALALMDKHKRYDIPIYTDSMTALSWIRNKNVKTTLLRSSRNEEIFQLVDRAMQWLNTHEIKNQILKWDTRRWGEIPADFGRK